MPTKKFETVDQQLPEVLATSPEADWQEVRKKEMREAQERTTKIHQELSEPFPKEVERQLKKGGVYLTYIPVSEVINRLNKVLGFDAWSYEIIKCERDALDPDFIIAHVRMTVYPSTDKFVSATKDGFGGQKIKRTKTGEIVDLGDEFKGAVSDALKKAAQALGVGLYLARTEEAIEAEAEESIDPDVEALWDQFIELSKSLSAEAKLGLNEFWKTHAGDRPKPTRQTARMADLEALIQRCIDLQMLAE